MKVKGQIHHPNPILMIFLVDIQVRIETDPADRTQLRMTVASGDPTVTFEYVL